MYLLRARVEPKALHHGWDLYQTFFRSLESLHYLKNELLSCSKSCFSKAKALSCCSSHKPCSKTFSSVFGCHIDSSIRIYDTVSFSNPPTMILMQWLSQIIWRTYWESFSWNFSNWNGVNLRWIYPVSMSDSNITEKNLIWLAALRKNLKSCQIKASLNSSCQKNNPEFRNWRSC